MSWEFSTALIPWLVRVKKARGRGNPRQSFSDPWLEIRGYVVKPRTAGEASVKSQNKGTASQRSLIFWVPHLLGLTTSKSPHLYTDLTVRDDFWGCCIENESKAFSGIDGSAWQSISDV